MQIDALQWQWIEQNRMADTAHLRLHLPSHISPLAIEQIEGRKSASAKLRHTLSRAPRFIFPSGLLAQQSTSDAVARYHASLLSAEETHLLDMTGGLGIDAFHFAAQGRHIDVCEINPDACTALEHNAGLLKFTDIKVLVGDSVSRLKELEADSYDTIFIDPARRESTQGRRLRSLVECSPDVTAIWREMLRVAPRVLVKVSPMLDISALQAELPPIQSITAVGHRRSVSELLLELRREVNPSERTVRAVTLDDDGNVLTENKFAWTPHRHPVCFASPAEGKIWIEPYAPIMKTGRFNELSISTGVEQLSRHAHVYITDDPAQAREFPGIAYTIEHIAKADKRSMRNLKSEIGIERAEVAIRDFPMSAEELRKALGIMHDGDRRIVGCRDASGAKLLLILHPAITCEKVVP